MEAIQANIYSRILKLETNILTEHASKMAAIEASQRRMSELRLNHLEGISLMYCITQHQIAIFKSMSSFDS